MSTLAYKGIPSNAFLAILSPYTAAMPVVPGEKRSERIPLKVTPALSARIEALCVATKRRRNDLLNLLLELEISRVERDPAERAKL
jgi:hypothetical protein